MIMERNIKQQTINYWNKRLYLPFLVQQKDNIAGKWSNWMNVHRYQTIYEANKNIYTHQTIYEANKNIHPYSRVVKKWRIRFVIEPLMIDEISKEEDKWITYYVKILNQLSSCDDCEMYPMGTYCVNCKHYIDPPF
jgi:hypothetical protein